PLVEIVWSVRKSASSVRSRSYRRQVLGSFVSDSYLVSFRCPFIRCSSLAVAVSVFADTPIHLGAVSFSNYHDIHQNRPTLTPLDAHHDLIAVFGFAGTPFTDAPFHLPTTTTSMPPGPLLQRR